MESHLVNTFSHQSDQGSFGRSIYADLILHVDLTRIGATIGLPDRDFALIMGSSVTDTRRQGHTSKKLRCDLASYTLVAHVVVRNV